MSTTLSCFKAYDIRGQLGEQLNPEVAYRIGKAFAEYLSADSVVVGGDVRLTSAGLKQCLSAGLIDGGAKVIDIGMTGTEEIYYAAKSMPVSGGIEVTASHNPIDYNGMKLVREGARPISGDTGLDAVKALAESYLSEDVQSALDNYGMAKLTYDEFMQGQTVIDDSSLAATGSYQHLDNRSGYVEHLMTYIDKDKLTPLKVVVNAGNGAAGAAMDSIEAQFKSSGVPVEFIKVHHQPDGTFPNGIPNPLLPECRADTADAVIEHSADMGIAWDGDFDRCFLFDEKGQFIEGYYIVGLLAEAFLQKNTNAKIIYDPRVYWNTEDIVTTNHGIPVKSKTGHAFIKERMRAEDAVYGGEMSAHHYFRDFAYCDSGMIPWLLVAELLCVKNTSLSEMVAQRISAFPSSGEINSKLADPDAAIARVMQTYEPEADVIDHIDGIGMEFGTWRFNLRKSNTEPVIRLNVESRGNETLMQQKTEELLALIRQ